MNPMPCDALDDFLAGELAGDRRREFEAHLGDCPACRTEVAEWQNLSRKLKAATEELEVPPADLAHRIERAAKFDGQTAVTTGRTWRIAALIAASLLAAALFRESFRPTLRPNGESALTRPISVTAVPKPAVLCPSVEVHGKVIGVPIDVGDPNVTVVWLYPEAAVAEAEK
jgi:putative zinc finger protein